MSAGQMSVRWNQGTDGLPRAEAPAGPGQGKGRGSGGQGQDTTEEEGKCRVKYSRAARQGDRGMQGPPTTPEGLGKGLY